MRHSALARFSFGSSEQAIWIRPMRNLERCTSTIVTAARAAMMTFPKVKYAALVLFDIDGTLVRRAGPHHREALVQGIRRVTGLDTTTDGIPVQGMLDPEIIRVMMQRVGARAKTIASAMPEVLRAAERHYLRVCPALHDKHCPGVEPLLQRL